MSTKDLVKKETPAKQNNLIGKKEITHSRRKALKKIGSGSGIAVGASSLPPQWAKPIVDKVVFPAHAETSPEPTTTTTTTTAAPATTTTTPTTTAVPCENRIACAFNSGDSLTIDVSTISNCADPNVSTDFTNAVIRITVIDIGPLNYPCPPSPFSTWLLNSSGEVSITVWPCELLPAGPYDLIVRVEFEDKATFGDHSSTCEYHIPR